MAPLDETKKLEQDMTRVCATDSGRNVLRYLMSECGFHNASIVADQQSGEINPLGTVYNEARRNLWLKLRKLMSREHLIAVELGEHIEEQK